MSHFLHVMNLCHSFIHPALLLGYQHHATLLQLTLDKACLLEVWKPANGINDNLKP